MAATVRKSAVSCDTNLHWPVILGFSSSIYLKQPLRIIIHANSSRGGVVFTVVCLSVFPLTKADAARISKLDVQMFHNESWKHIDFGVRRSKVKDTSRLTWVFALLL